MQEDILEYFDGKAGKPSGNDHEGEALLSAEVKETLKVWEHAAMDTSAFCPDVDCAWSLVKGRISTERRIQPLQYFYWAAASAALILVGVFVFKSEVTKGIFSATSTIASQQSVREVTLVDGSKVWLNRNSEIIFSKDEPREVQLKGEAYFKVAHDAEIPFVVEAEGISVKVLGTEFTLLESSKGYSVAVLDGTVEVNTLDRVLRLEKNQRIDVSANENTVRRSDISDFNFLAWKTGEIGFERKRLEDVLSKMERHYGADIQVSDKALNDCVVTVTLKGLTLEESLEVVATLVNGSVKKNGQAYTILAGPCQN